MGLLVFPTFTLCHPWNYGRSVSRAGAGWHRATAPFAFASLVLIISAIVSSVPAKAQQASQPGFDPRQTEKRFDASQSGQTPAARSGLQMPRLSRPEARADSKPLVKLRQVSVTGALTIPADQLITAYQPYLGKEVSQADLVAIAGAISDLYRAAGFHLSRAIVPPQDIRDGHLRLQVIEGSITEVALKGEDAERFGVVVHVKTWRVYTWFGVDNLGSSTVGPWQTYATGAFNSYLLHGDTLALNLSTTPGDPRELAFGRLSYEVPVGTDGMRIGASALYSEVRPGDFRRLYNDNTRTESYEIRGSVVPLQSQASTLTLTAAAGFSNVSESDVLGPFYNDHIRAVSLTSDYRLQDNFGGNNYFTLMWRQGLDILGASHKGDDFLSRDGASGNFSVIDFWFTRYQTLSDAWSVKMSGAGQIASGPLFASQQFYLGGAAFGRGYGSAEISGDNGVAGSLELRFDQKLSFQYLTGYQLYGFVDAGAAWNDGYSYTDGLSLTSAGAGVRLFLGGDLRADIAVAVPLGYRAPDNSSRSARLLFSLSNSFKLCPERAQARCL